MGRGALPNEYMLPAELAKCMGRSTEWVQNELRRDSKREIKLYPFAIATKNEKTGTWSYRIHRKRYERWDNGDDICNDHLASLIAEKVAAALKGA